MQTKTITKIASSSTRKSSKTSSLPPDIFFTIPKKFHYCISGICLELSA